MCSKDSSLRCTICKAAIYCGRECQVEDHQEHKRICKSVKKLTDIISREKAILRDSLDVDLFADESANFWEYPETRLYMRTRVSHFHLLGEIGTECALREAVTQGKSIIKEGKGNHPEVRYMIPSIYLRLNDPTALQECYDFMKLGDIYAKSYELEVAHQNCQSDMCESLYSLHQVDLYNVVALTITKMRLLLEIEQFLSEFDILLNATIRPSSSLHIVGGNQGILISVSSFLLPNYTCFTNKKISQLRFLRTTLSTQVQTLLDVAENSHDKRIWKILVNPSQLQQHPRSLRFPSKYGARILTAALCYIPFFSTENKKSRALRQILVDRVGEAPDYKFSVIQGTVCVVSAPW